MTPSLMTEATPRAEGQLDAVIVRSAPPGGSALARALRNGDVGAEWLLALPESPDAWRSRIAGIRAASEPGWADRLAPAFAATGAARDRLARAVDRGAVVTTGQQPGLFGGPAYTWTKAMGALAFADALEQATGVPVAPVFWAATDDADWLEASVTHLLMRDGVRTIALPGPATDGIAMNDVRLGDTAEALAALRAAAGSAASRSVLELVEGAYVPHATIGAAYLALLRALLEPWGIAVLDASHPATRAAADPVLRRALTAAPAVRDALRQRREAIVTAGHTPQVETLDELSLVFRTSIGASGREGERTRDRVPVADAARVAREAERGTLGANVLLRPVLEQCLLPTVAYLAGPGEYAYFAQVGPVAAALGVPQPLVLPRWAGEVVETRSLDLLESLELDEAALSDPHGAESIVARRVLEEPIQDALERLRLTIETQTGAVGGALRDAVAPGEAPVAAASVVEGLERDLLGRIARFERRLVAGVKRREASLMRDVAHVRGALRPYGKSPERTLNLVPMLARHGTGLLGMLRDGAGEHAQALLRGDTRVP